jgi:hypothetical protein
VDLKRLNPPHFFFFGAIDNEGIARAEAEGIPYPSKANRIVWIANIPHIPGAGSPTAVRFIYQLTKRICR